MLSSTTVRATVQGSGSAGPFSFLFKIFAATDLLVQKTSAAGVVTQLNYPTDYTVPSGIGDAAGGTLTLTVALATGETLSILRAVPNTQPTSLRALGTFLPGTIEDELDRLTMLVQQNTDAIKRSARLQSSIDPAVFATEIPVPVANQALVAKADGTGWEARTIDTASASLLPSGRTVPSLTAYLANNATFNVKDFGAVGDGVTDDSAKIQAAINAAIAVVSHDASQLGAVVYLPPGTYIVGTPLQVPAYVSIRGLGGDASILKAAGDNDMIVFTQPATLCKSFYEDFGIVGHNPGSTGSPTSTAIKYLGTATVSDSLDGMSIRRLRITDYQTAIRLRTTSQVTISECWMGRVNVGIDLRGSNLANWITRNTIEYLGGCGTGTVAGVIIDGTSDYNPGGTTLHFPESIHVVHNYIFGFVNCIKVTTVTYCVIEDCDLSSTAETILVSACNGVLDIKNCYLEVGSVGVRFSPIGAIAQTKMNVAGCHFISAGSATYGVQAGTLFSSGNQTNLTIRSNSFSGFSTHDIDVALCGDVTIEDNNCFSSIGTSINLNQMLTGNHLCYVEKNRCVGNIAVLSSPNNSPVIMGANGGTFSTLIRGHITIPSGLTTKTLTYASMGTTPANFDTTGNTGFDIVPFFGAPPANIGAVWGSATTTSVTINCGSAPGSNVTIPFEVRAVLSNAG